MNLFQHLSGLKPKTNPQEIATSRYRSPDNELDKKILVYSWQAKLFLGLKSLKIGYPIINLDRL
ncbi:hypothetical protein APB85_11600 [Salegentibacter mishustinae]|nr:hypothetical protein APB85_11600 [Salegentibacter mishustinae]